MRKTKAYINYLLGTRLLKLKTKEMFNMNDMTQEELLEKEIADKQKQLHDLRYGEIESAYDDFMQSKDIALEKYNYWKKLAETRGGNPNNMLFYFNSWRT
tara:strand:+ start:1288 stop:1587 length:300 start_codon:yes stop_codon:yes gene_type:complete